MSRTRARHAAVAVPLLLLVLALAVAGCGMAAATPASQEEAEQAACDAIAKLDAEVAKLDDLDPAVATVEDVTRQRAAIQGAWSAVQVSLGAVSVADKAGVLAAGQALEAALGAIPSGTSPAETLATVKGAVAPLKAVHGEMQDGMGCAKGGGGGGGASPSPYRYDY